GKTVHRDGLAELQGLHVARNRPAVLRRCAIGERIHHAESARDHLDNLSARQSLLPRLVERWRCREAAQDHHTVSIAGIAVAGSAEGVVLVAPTREQRVGYGWPRRCERRKRFT